MAELSDGPGSWQEPEFLEFLFFGASWCGPCVQFQPIVHEMVAETRRKTAGSVPPLEITSRAIDVDAEPTPADEAGVSDLPTTIVLLNKTEVLRIVGSRPKRQLRAEVSAVLGERWQDGSTTDSVR